MSTTEQKTSGYRFDEDEEKSINYAKAIGIIAVVIGHYPGNPFNYFNPYLFHMPLFFFLGGVLLNENRKIQKHTLTIIRKHAFYIVYIYISTVAITWTIHLIYPIDYESLWKGGLFSSAIYAIKSNFHGGSYFLVGWFLFAYMIASITSLPLIKSIQKITNSKLISSLSILSLSLLSAYLGIEVFSQKYNTTNIFYFNTISQVSVGLSFILLGYLLKPILFKITNIYGLLLAFCFLYILQKYDLINTMGMSWSSYPELWYVHISTALIGIYSVIVISKILSSQKDISLLEKTGIQSKSIMSFHLLVFILIDIIFFHLESYDISKTRPLDHFVSEYSWPIYISAAVLIPIFGEQAYSAIKNRLKQKLTTTPPN